MRRQPRPARHQSAQGSTLPQGQTNPTQRREGTTGAGCWTRQLTVDELHTKGNRQAYH